MFDTRTSGKSFMEVLAISVYGFSWSRAFGFLADIAAVRLS